VYHAQLHIDSDSLQAVPSVPVTMTVTAPATWGKVEGIVSSLGICNQTPSPLENAQVVIQPSAGSPVNLTTNEDGHYSYWFDQAASPLSVSATAPAHTSQTVPGVVVTAGNTTPVNLLLSWLQCNYLNLPMILRGPQP
jgi:hypothetical protein